MSAGSELSMGPGQSTAQFEERQRLGQPRERTQGIDDALRPDNAPQRLRFSLAGIYAAPTQQPS
jgi:hypothetical protein